MASRTEWIKSCLIGTTAGRLAQRVQRWRSQRQMARDPSLVPVSREAGHIDQVLQRVLQPASNCVDAGAHLGSMTADFLRLAPAGRHVAIEPTPRKAEWLRRKFPAVTVIQAALSDVEGEATFFDDTGNSGVSGLRRPDVFASGEFCTYPVPLVRLDDALEGCHVDFLKVDVEGAELNAFRGGRELLRRCRPFILFECTMTGLNQFEVRPEEVFAEVTQMSGYDVFIPGEWLTGGGAARRLVCSSDDLSVQGV